MYVQGFPEYGPERMGAPITAYNRISKNPVRVHSNIYEPDFVVVVDETLIESVDVTKGLKEDGAIIINSSRLASDFIPFLKGYKGKVFTCDARTISEETLGKNFPNTPMLGAVVKVSKVMEEKEFLKKQGRFKHLFKPENRHIIDRIQANVDLKWERLLKRCGEELDR